MKYLSIKTMGDRNRLAAQCRKPVYQRSSSPAVPKVNEYLLEHKGLSMIITTHARLQGFKRYDMSTANMTDFFTRVIDGVMDFKWEYNDQEIFVYSRKYQRGTVITHRSDYKTGKRCLVAITLYPYGKNRPLKSSTPTVYVD